MSSLLFYTSTSCITAFYIAFSTPPYEHISGKAFYFYNSDTHSVLLRLEAIIPVPDDFAHCHKTKTKIFQQQVAAWVRTCEQPAQPTLGNPACCLFRQQIILYLPPRFSPPETGFTRCIAPQATDFSAPRYSTLSKGYALKSYSYLPI